MIDTTKQVTGISYNGTSISLPTPGITPSGSLSVTENGTVDCTNYASVVVNVASSSLPEGFCLVKFHNNNQVLQGVFPQGVPVYTVFNNPSYSALANIGTTGMTGGYISFNNGTNIITHLPNASEVDLYMNVCNVDNLAANNVVIHSASSGTPMSSVTYNNENDYIVNDNTFYLVPDATGFVGYSSQNNTTSLVSNLNVSNGEFWAVWEVNGQLKTSEQRVAIANAEVFGPHYNDTVTLIDYANQSYTGSWCNVRDSMSSGSGFVQAGDSMYWGGTGKISAAIDSTTLVSQNDIVNGGTYYIVYNLLGDSENLISCSEMATIVANAEQSGGGDDEDPYASESFSFNLDDAPNHLPEQSTEYSQDFTDDFGNSYSTLTVTSTQILFDDTVIYDAAHSEDDTASWQFGWALDSETESTNNTIYTTGLPVSDMLEWLMDWSSFRPASGQYEDNVGITAPPTEDMTISLERPMVAQDDEFNEMTFYTIETDSANGTISYGDTVVYSDGAWTSESLSSVILPSGGIELYAVSGLMSNFETIGTLNEHSGKVH